MAAYGAALLLLKTLKKSISSIGPTYGLSGTLYSLKHFLAENREVKAEFETQIRDVIYEAQDIIDTHMWSAHFLSPSEAKISRKRLREDLERLTQKIYLIAEKTTEEFNHLTLDREISALDWKNPDEISRKKLYYPLVGRDEDINELKDRLMNGSDALQVVPIVGVAGMGKTALARSLLIDPEIVDHFDVVGRVKVSIKCNKRDKLLDILESLRKSSMGIREVEDGLEEYEYSWTDEIQQMTDQQLGELIKNSLKDKTYIILLDDIRAVASWNDLQELFPDHYNGSRILLTTRYVEVAPAPPHVLERLSDEVALPLLEEIAFDGEQCSEHLANIAKDIARSCRGLPHAVVIVGKLLSCAKPTAEYWEIVLSSIISTNNYDDLIEALLSLTYDHLPQQLKVCLLYMAIFPYNYFIPRMKLEIQWIAEGLDGMVQTAQVSNNELSKRGFLVSRVKSRDYLNASVRIAEESFHDFLVRKAKEEKFFFVINKEYASYAFRQGDTTYNQQRRLCIQQNIHQFIKDLPTCNMNSLARSLIYSFPEHQYRIGAWSAEFKLLKVLDAVKVGFYTIPPEILKSIQLKFLAFSYNGRLPVALCNLRNLQVLIVSLYLNMKCSGAPSYLPIEIWNLEDLMHLQVEGSDLPEPPSSIKLKKNLQHLLGVSARSCTRNIFERVRRLSTLEVCIESLQEDETLSFFSYLQILDLLSSFKCIVIYPDIRSQVVPPSIPKFPYPLKNLTLNGCGFPWEYMRSIAALPKLEFLNLQSYAFQGPEWEVKTDEFPKLTTLVLEDLDFENWTFDSSTGSRFDSSTGSVVRFDSRNLSTGSIVRDSRNPSTGSIVPFDSSTGSIFLFDSSTGSIVPFDPRKPSTCPIFPNLESLIIRNCYKLRHIPSVFADSSTLKLLEVVDCSTSAMISAQKIKVVMPRWVNNSAQFDIYSSFE